MAIRERVVRTYAVVCDNCGKRADWGYSEEEAKLIAYEAEWSIQAHFVGDYERFNRHFCPECVTELFEQSKEA